MTVRYGTIENFPKYRIGADGSVWSRQKGEWKKLKLTKISSGYLQVALYHYGRRRQALVHTLVLEAFVGPKPIGMEARHYPDQNPENNNASNLSWSDHTTNNRDRWENGTYLKGEEIPWSKLTSAEVKKIRRMYASKKYSQKELAATFGISQVTISSIIRRRIWKHIE